MTVISTSARFFNEPPDSLSSWITHKQSPIDQVASINPRTHVVHVQSLNRCVEHEWQDFDYPSEPQQSVECPAEAGLTSEAENNARNPTPSLSPTYLNSKNPGYCCSSCLPLEKKIHPTCFRLMCQCHGWHSLSYRFRCECPLLRRIRRHVANENLFVLNLIQMLCGLSAIILTSVAMTKTVFLYQMGTGMWAGLIMLVTGTQGLLAARRPMLCTLIGLLIMSLVASIAACFLIGVSVAGTIEDGFLDRSRRYPSSSFSQSPDNFKFTYTFTLDNVQRSSHYPYRSKENRTNLLNHRLHTVGNEFGTAEVPSLPDSHLRTCRVILHVLLLFVGILESSIGLSTVVLCCRYVCSRSSHGRQHPNSPNGVLPQTRIVSFDANAATQAANLLQSGYMNRLASSGSVLLAVGTDTLLEHDQQFLNSMDSPNNAMLKPHIHDMVHTFLPESISPSALILTQAGTGTLAWTAARAAAFVVRGSNPAAVGDDSNSSPTESSPPVSSTNTRQGQRSQQLPRLLFTPVSTPINIPSTVPTDFYDVSASCPPGSTFLYVMPSPSRGEPPLIFPPFPPTYSELQRRPYLPTTNYRHNTTDTYSIRNPPPYSRQIMSDQRSIRSGSRRTTTMTNGRLRVVRSLHSGRRLIIRLRRSVRPRRTRPSVNVRPSATSLLCAIDRLLQPVVIVGSPNSSVLSYTNPICEASPPEYSAIEAQ